MLNDVKDDVKMQSLVEYYIKHFQLGNVYISLQEASMWY